jgi:predicted GH43/DUF377 family glycosyl hydrolase
MISSLKWFVPAVVLAFAGACGAPHDVTTHAWLDEALVQHQDVVPRALEVRQLAYNASVARIDDNYLMVFRIDTFAPGEQVPRMQQLGLMALDGNLSPTGPHSLLATPHEPGQLPTAEDPRLFDFQGTPYVIYNAAVFDAPLPGRRMFIARLAPTDGPEGRSWAVERAKELVVAAPGLGRRIEKNWTPFVYNGAIHLIYKTNPPIVFRLDMATLDDDRPRAVAHLVAQNHEMVDFGFGQMRGGTPALYVPELDEYISFFHASRDVDLGSGRKRYYLMGAYTFAPEPPFAIRRLTRTPLATPEAADVPHGSTRIAFPQGLVDNGEQFLVSYGRDDAAISVMTVDKRGIIDQLEPVSP